MKTVWTEEQKEFAGRLQQALFLAAASVAIDELTPEQGKRLRLIIGEIREAAEQGDTQHHPLVAEIKRISGVALHQAYEAVMQTSKGIEA